MAKATTTTTTTTSLSAVSSTSKVSSTILPNLVLCYDSATGSVVDCRDLRDGVLASSHFNIFYANNAAEIVSFMVEGVLFGFYTCLAFCALYALMGHQQRGRQRTVLLAALIALLVLSASDIVLSTIRIIDALFSGPKFIDTTQYVFEDRVQGLTYSRHVIQAVVFAVGNTVLTWKCYCLRPKLWLISVPAVLVLTSTVLGVIPFLLSYSNAVSLLANLVLSAIIAVSMWKDGHCCGVPFSNKTERFAVIYLESAAVLVIFQAGWLVAVFTSTIATNLMTAMTVPVGATTYTFAIVRLGLGDKITLWLKRLAPPKAPVNPNPRHSRRAANPIPTIVVSNGNRQPRPVVGTHDRSLDAISLETLPSTTAPPYAA